MAVKYLETGSVSPYYNLAFEEYVLQNRRDGDYLLLWQNDRAVIVGQNQNAEAETDLAFAKAHGVSVARRATGGGAVYHDLGNLNYSFITDAGDESRLTMERFTLPVAEALRGLGLAAEVSGRNDILVDGKKVSGTAQRLLGGRILHHGTLLFDADPDMVAGALRADPRKFTSKGVSSVRSRIGNIRPLLKTDMDMPAFWEYLRAALARDGLAPDALAPAELEGVRALERDKYATWEWNFGRSPAYGVRVSRRFDGGSVEAGVEIKKGRIERIGFYGDFLSRSPLKPLTEALRGCPFRREDVAEILGRFSQTAIFGGVTRDEILELLFGGPEE